MIGYFSPLKVSEATGFLELALVPDLLQKPFAQQVSKSNRNASADRTNGNPEIQNFLVSENFHGQYFKNWR